MSGAFQLWRQGMARCVDAAALVFLAWLGGQVIFGGSQPFYSYAFWFTLIASAGCVLDPTARRNIPVPLILFLLAMVAAEAGGSASAGDFRLVEGRPLYYVALMAAFVFGVAYVLRTPRRLGWLGIGLVIMISVIALQLVFDRYETNFPDPRKTSAWQYSPSVTQWGSLHQSGLLLILALPFVFAPIVIARRLSLLVAALICAGALAVAAYINGSRSGVLAMTGVVVAMLTSAVWMRVRDWRVRALSIALLAIPLLLAFAVLTGRTPIPPPATLTGARAPIWSAAFAIFRDHPWLGGGPGTYYNVMTVGGYGERYQAEPFGFLQAHNMWLHAAAETGAVGVIAYATWWAWLLLGTFRHWRTDGVSLMSIGLTFALVGFLMRAMTDNFLDGLPTTDRTRLLVWMLWGAALAVQRLPRRREA